VVGGCLGLRNHEMIEFSIHDKLKKGVQQNHHHGLSEGRLWPVRDAG